MRSKDPIVLLIKVIIIGAIVLSLPFLYVFSYRAYGNYVLKNKTEEYLLQTYSEDEIKSMKPRGLKIGYEIDVIFEDEPDVTYRYSERDGEIFQNWSGFYYTDFSKLKHYEKPKEEKPK